MITIGAGFKLSGTTDPNFSRDVAETIADLRAIGLADLDRGHIVFCKSTGKYYSFDQDGQHTNNPVTGYFTELSTGGDSTPSPDVPAIVFLTQAEYNSLAVKDAGTLYFIVPPSGAWTFGMTFPVVLQ